MTPAVGPILRPGGVKTTLCGAGSTSFECRLVSRAPTEPVDRRSDGYSMVVLQGNSLPIKKLKVPCSNRDDLENDGIGDSDPCIPARFVKGRRHGSTILAAVHSSVVLSNTKHSRRGVGSIPNRQKPRHAFRRHAESERWPESRLRSRSTVWNARCAKPATTPIRYDSTATSPMLPPFSEPCTSNGKWE